MDGVTSETDVILESEEFDTEEPLINLQDDAAPKTLNAEQYFGQEQTMNSMDVNDETDETTDVDDSIEEDSSGSGFSGDFSGSADQSSGDSFSGQTISEQSLDIMMSETEVLVQAEENDTEVEENDLKEMLSSNIILAAETVPSESDIEDMEEEENTLLDADVLEELGVVQFETDFE